MLVTVIAVIILISAAAYLRRSAFRPKGYLTPDGNTWKLKPLDIPAEFSGPRLVNSDFDKRQQYIVNLQESSCTCQDFRKRRQKLPVDDPKRFCKHLWRLADKAKVFDSMGEFERELRRALAEHTPDIAVKTEMHNTPCVLTHKHGTDWVNVVCISSKKSLENEKSTYKSFGYNVKKRRWAYGSYPYGLKKEIEAQIASLIRGLPKQPSFSYRFDDFLIARNNLNCPP